MAHLDLPLEPGFPIVGPTGSSWREHALARITELETLASLFKRRQQLPDDDPLVQATFGHLADAKREAAARRWPWARLSGASVERTMVNIDAAEADLLQIAPLDYLQGQLPSLLAHVGQHLPEADPRRAALRKVIDRAGHGDLQERDRGSIISIARAASSEARREEVRVRSFRNVLLVATAVLTAIALALGALGALTPRLLPLCFAPLESGQVVCPVQDGPRVAGEDLDVVVARTVSAWDVPIVMLVGLVAAAVASAAALRHIKGTSTPYALPTALALLKLPTGAITAVLGLLLLRGNFVPGLSALDTSAQILAWSVVFGYAQQVFTRLVDDRAETVLNSVGRPPEASPTAGQSRPGEQS